MRTAFIFPGQGSQSVGMGRALSAAFVQARDTFAEADEVLSQHLSRLMFDGPADTLTLTQNAQPALFAMSAAVLRVCRAQLGDFRAHFYAGHSLGEYAALYAAGVLDFADALRLLRLRGEAMQQAVPAGTGGMAAVLGADADAVAAACVEASTLDSVCVPANDNAPGQIVISGHTAALSRVEALLKERGVKRVLPLSVSAPFHSPLMLPAARTMRLALERCAFKTPHAPIVCNVTAGPEHRPDVLRTLLVEQITAPVRWRETQLHLSEVGVTHVYELGAGNVLCGLAKRTVPSLQAQAIGTPEAIDALALSVA